LTLERFTFERLQTTLLFLAIATAACLMPAQHDTWWLLRAGHDMWGAGHVLLTDTFSHTVSGAYWPNHEWLSELLFYGVYALGGLPLLTLASALVVTSAWAIVWVETPGPVRVKFLLTAFVVASASTTWSLRAQVLSLLLVALTMALLRRRRYAWLPVVFFCWANLHGAVLLGMLLLGAALAAALIEKIEAVPRLLLATALCVVATSLTPLGGNFWLDMPRSLGRIRQLGIDEVIADVLPEDKAAVVQRLKAEGRVVALRERIIHDDRKSMRSFIARQRRYMRDEAAKLKSADPRTLNAAAKLRKLRVIAPLLESIVTTPRQFPQPPAWGPCVSSSARFHSTMPRDQPRVEPMMSSRVNQRSESAQPLSHSPPEHSVRYAFLSGCAACTGVWAETSPP